MTYYGSLVIVLKVCNVLILSFNIIVVHRLNGLIKQSKNFFTTIFKQEKNIHWRIQDNGDCLFRGVCEIKEIKQLR